MEVSENLNHKHQTWMWERYNETWIFRLGQFHNTVNSNIRLLFIINSGTVLSLLTFAGHQHKLDIFYKLRFSFWVLLLGVFSSVLCSIMEMLRQDIVIGNLGREWKARLEDPGIKRDEKYIEDYSCIHQFYNMLAWFFGLISFCSFLVGTIISVYILSNP